MATTNVTTLEHGFTVDESIISEIINANPMVAAVALEIAQSGGDTAAAIEVKLQSWGADGQNRQMQMALRTLVDWYAQ